MSVSWEPCDGLPPELERDIRDRYLGAIADDKAIAYLQGDLQSEGYRLINPRFEWIQDREPKWVDLGGVEGAQVDGYQDDGKALTLISDGVERISAE